MHLAENLTLADNGSYGSESNKIFSPQSMKICGDETSILSYDPVEKGIDQGDFLTGIGSEVSHANLSASCEK